MGVKRKTPRKGRLCLFAGGGRSLELTPISVPIPVNRVINWESNQYPPESNEATTPYPVKMRVTRGFALPSKKIYQGIF